MSTHPRDEHLGACVDVHDSPACDSNSWFSFLTFHDRVPGVCPLYFCSVGRADDAAAAAPSPGLSYPEWIELLGLIAYVTAAYNNTSNGGFSSMPMLQRLHLLFYNMSRGGARFPAGDAGASLVREATEAVTGGQPARR